MENDDIFSGSDDKLKFVEMQIVLKLSKEMKMQLKQFMCMKDGIYLVEGLIPQ
jgi:hypothetical protein